MTFAGRNLNVVDERLLSTNWGGLQTNKEFNSAINAQYLPRGKWTADFNSIRIFTTAQCTFSQLHNAHFYNRTIRIFTTAQFAFSQPHNAHFHNRTMHIFTTAQFVFSQPRNSHFHNRTMRIFTTAQCTFSQPVSDRIPKCTKTTVVVYLSTMISVRDCRSERSR